ncbi:MAG TPA: 3-dehydroquinate synthase [Prolixibacteraceae bacterium]|nr:3-dehydroquinate synthase [Prolixibacteraceae bacterium]HPS12002.1 3-dehydroquinate synthase [Prolixibacteraceae bacterium]
MNIPAFENDIRVTNELEKELGSIVAAYPEGKVYLVVDENTREFCLPQLQQYPVFASIPVLEIRSGEENKSLESVVKVWNFLEENNADRKSLLINLGGGMLSDLCGFAASCFKRGLHFVNIPTTLLSQVDASVGGKTGINFNGLKNEIGVFNQPRTVIIVSRFLKSLDRANLLSGYAEMLKHGLIHSKPHWDECLAFDLDNIDYELLNEMIGRSVAVKEYFVVKDPTEKNIRKALNLGHTVGHAFESLALHQNRPILHGYAVAYGMVVELFLSSKKAGFPMEETERISKWIVDTYGAFTISPSDFETLYLKMTKDKKNEAGRINFTLVPEIGKVEINVDCERELILEGLEFFRKLNSSELQC